MSRESRAKGEFFSGLLASIPESIWKGQPWSITGKFVFDGVLYGITTGLTFAWLWPAGV